MTCWNYLRAWQKAGVWERLHEVLLAELQEAERIDWSVDSTHARALGGGEKTGQNPTDRRKLGTKHHLVTDASGIPLAVTITGSNVHDVKEMLHVVDAILLRSFLARALREWKGHEAQGST
jgi:transposase